MNRLAYAALAVAGLLLAGCIDEATLNDSLHRMANQKKTLPYGSNPMFEDGRAMRQPPHGTVPRSALATIGPISRGGSADAGWVTENPVQMTPELMARGREKFDIYCAVCHGIVGDGNSQVARNMSLRPPPSLHLRTELTDGYLFETITEGFGIMPGYANEIPVEERWAVVAYLRALQLSQSATLDMVPPEERQKLSEASR